MPEVGKSTAGDVPEFCKERKGFLHPDLLLNGYTLGGGFLMMFLFHLMPFVAYACREDVLNEARNGMTGFRAALIDAWASVARVAKKAVRAICRFDQGSVIATRFITIGHCLGRCIFALNMYFLEQIDLNFIIPGCRMDCSFELPDFYGFRLEIILLVGVIEQLLATWASMYQKKINDYSARDEDWWKNDKVIDSKFLDLSVPWSTATVIFLSQVALFSMYVYDMGSNSKTHNRCNVSVYNLLIGVLVTNAACLGDGGEKCVIWKKCAVWGIMCDHRCGYRCVYDAVINQLCRTSVLLFAPVALCVADPGDFVKDCLAMLIIFQMDDIEPKRIGEALKDWAAELEAADDREEHENTEPEGQSLEDGLLQDYPVKGGLEDRIRVLEEKLKRLDGDEPDSRVGYRIRVLEETGFARLG